VKDTVHAFAHQFRRPHLVLRETNRLLVEKGLPGFVTAFLGFLDVEHGTLTYSSAGHPPPMLCARGRVTLLESFSLPLGAFADAQYRDTEAKLEKGSLLLFYTDGITEARRDGELFGEERLAASLARAWSGPIETLPSLLLEEAVAFSGGLLRDDAALLAVSYLAEDQQPGLRE
jgi:sigma-B regulation protein RsbU (phosphoserine phosphatase)